MTLAANLSAFVGTAGIASTGVSSSMPVSSLTSPIVNGTTTLSLQTGGTTGLYIDANQNVGIGGVTPNTWTNTFRAVQVQRSAWAPWTNNTNLAYNWYWNSADKYIANDYASLYQQNGTAVGGHSWLVAPSGTANATITWNQAMTLNAGGQLLVGETSESDNTRMIVAAGSNSNAIKSVTKNTSGAYIEVIAAGSTAYSLNGWANCAVIEGTTSSTGSNALVLSGYNGPVVFQVNSRTTAMNLNNSGYLGIGSNSASYNLDVNNQMRVGLQGGTDVTIIKGGSGYGSGIYGYYADGTIQNQLLGNGTSFVNAGQKGNFGVGTSSPSYLLDVAGTAHSTGLIVQSSVATGTTNSIQGTYTLGNGRYFNSASGSAYIHILLPARYNSSNSMMWMMEIKGYEFDTANIINLMIAGYVTPVSNGGPMSRAAATDPATRYSPTAYYSSTYNVGVARFYLPDKYYATFTVNTICVGNGDIIGPGELRIIESSSSTL